MKIGLSLSMIGGTLFFILIYIFFKHYYSMWQLQEELLILFLFFLFINVGAITGAFLGFFDKRIGIYLCFIAGIIYPLLCFYYFLLSPSTFFIGFFESLIESFYISIPMLLLFTGGSISFIKMQLELKK